MPKIGFRRAVNLKCKDCIYDKFDAGTWRQQVAACTSPDCPLYTLRPLPSPTATPEATTQCE